MAALPHSEKLFETAALMEEKANVAGRVLLMLVNRQWKAGELWFRSPGTGHGHGRFTDGLSAKDGVGGGAPRMAALLRAGDKISHPDKLFETAAINVGKPATEGWRVVVPFSRNRT